MFKSYRKVIASTMLMAVTTTLSLTGSDIYRDASNTYASGKKVIDGGVTYPVRNDKTSAYYVNENADKVSFNLGRKATKNEIKAWNIDIMWYGEGLPKGQGSVEDGEEIYEAKCETCHGDFGAGKDLYPHLTAGNAYEEQKSLTHQRVDGNDEGPHRTIGSNWPYISTLWWYIKSAMPHQAPMTLTNDEVYALTAYILNINEIEIDGKLIEEEFVLTRDNFTKIHLPNEDGFEPKIRGEKGQENARAYFNNPKNFGAITTRCMKNCFDGEPVIARIGHPIDAYLPPMSIEKKLPEVEEGSDVDPKVKKAYDASCAMCHATDSMGAPMAGDRKTWDATLKKGLDKVYDNAINGINGMPPKGGNMSLSDDEVKAIVDLMIK